MTLEIVYFNDYELFIKNNSFICGVVEKSNPIEQNPLEILVEENKDKISIEGAIVIEFGVASGKTLQIIAEAAGANVVHGFDSFEGLPEDWREGYNKGFFSTDGKVPVIKNNNALFHVGLFNDTIPKFVKDVMGGVGSGNNITLLHVDCCLYSSTKVVFDGLGEFIKDTIIIFDNLIGYDTFDKHGFMALWEWMDKTGKGSIFQTELLYVNGGNVGLRVVLRNV